MDRHVLLEGPQQHIRHGLRHHRDHLQGPVSRALRRERQPALEGAEEGPGRLRPPPNVPGVVVLQPPLHDLLVHLLPGWVRPAAHGAVVDVLLHACLLVVAGQAVAPAVDVSGLDVGEEQELLALLLPVAPQVIQPDPHLVHLLVLPGFELTARVVHLLHPPEGEGLGVLVVVDGLVALRLLGVNLEVVTQVCHHPLVHLQRLGLGYNPSDLDHPCHLHLLHHLRWHLPLQDLVHVDGRDPGGPRRLHLLDPLLDSLLQPLPHVCKLARSDGLLELSLVDLLLRHPLPHPRVRVQEGVWPQVHLPDTFAPPLLLERERSYEAALVETSPLPLVLLSIALLGRAHLVAFVLG
mmetsp:Transcript_31494/g.100790  ORF Transcript_31494/g.100790 Transcript_31494/m.100790 type:complete len:351 (-) Transcript_31494:463-1515(-)